MANANWAAAGNGSWYVGANWSSGLVPGDVGALGDSATLDAPGNYTVTVGTAAGTSVDTVNLNAAGATLGVSTQGLTVRTALNLNSGRLLLNGALTGGTLAMNGGVVMRNDDAALDGVRVVGALDLSTPYNYGALTLLNYGQLTLLDNTSFVAANGKSPGLIRVGGSALTFGNSAQFDNAAIDFLPGFRTASYLNLGTNLDGAGETVTFGQHAVLDVAANTAVTLGGNGTLINGGAINVAGTLTVDLEANLAQAAQPGTVTLQSGGMLAFAAQTAYDGTVAFKGSGAQLQFQGFDPASATLQDFQDGDSIDLQGVTYGGDVALSFLGGAVQISQGGVLMGRFQLTGGPASYGADQFSLADDGNGGTVLATTHVLNAEPDFDAAYYLAHNPDVAAAAGVDPLQHYLTYGWKEGRDPNAFFSTTYYLAQNPDVAAAHVNPLEHFEYYGWKEGRDPSLNFSIGKYLAAYPDVKAAGVDPLQQFLTAGRAQGRVASPVTPPATAADPLVDKAWYLAQHPDVAASGEDASANYHRVSWKLGYNPDQFFDTTYYLKANADVAAAGLDPLVHFETYGWKEGRQPSLAFSDDKYLANNPDVAAAKLDPLVHYLTYGQAEGRMTFINAPQATGAPDPLVDRAYYFAQFATIVPAAADAAASYDQTGWRQGLNPDAYFDTNYYLVHNADVRAAGLDPLKHYETYGWKEGRDPSAAFSTTKYLAAYADVRASGTDPLVSFVTAGQAQGRTAFAV